MNAMLINLLLYMGVALLGAVAMTLFGLLVAVGLVRMIDLDWFGLIIVEWVILYFPWAGAALGIVLRVVYRHAGKKAMVKVLGALLRIVGIPLCALIVLYAIAAFLIYLYSQRVQ